MRVGGADDRVPPPAGASDTAQLQEEVVDLRLVTDRIAADERRSRDDAVGEKSAAGRREEIALVASQREEGEAVAAVRIDQLPRHSPLPHRLRDRVPERTQPEIESERGEHDAEPEECVTGAGREVHAAKLRASHNRGDSRESGAEPEERADAGRVARDVEAPPEAHERREQKQRDRRLLEVEPLCEVGGGGGDDDRDCKLPGAPPALRKRARKPDQADPEDDGQNARRLGPVRRQDASDDLDPVGHLRRQRRHEPDHADECGPQGEEPLGAERT